MVESTAVWQGELLWPCTGLADAEIIDMSEVEAVGSWLYDWFRQHSHRCVVGADRRIRMQMQSAGLPILWYSTTAEAMRRHRGVTRSEREMLWDEDDG